MKVSKFVKIILLLNCGFIKIIFGATSKSAKCGACLAIVNEVNHEISKANPKEKLQVGSFRIDSRGNQNLQEVSYARSDVHLTEVFESVCGKLSDYKPSSKDDEAETYIRTKTFLGDDVPAESYLQSEDSIKSACEYFLEDHDEDDMIKLFKDPKKDVMVEFCVKESEVCDSHAPTKFTMANAVAMQEALKAKEERLKREEEEKKRQEEEEKLKQSEEPDEEGEPQEEDAENLEEEPPTEEPIDSQETTTEGHSEL